MKKQIAASIGVALISASMLASVAAIAEGEVTVYSARKEELIKPLLDQFTEKTGTKVNLLTGKYGDLQKRLEVEGVESPADVYITVDAGRLHNAKAAGLLQPFESAVIDAQIADHLRDADHQWVSLSLRARPIFLTENVNPDEIKTYADLADKKWHGRICIRSSSNIYNQSLLASIIAHDGEDAAQAWANGIVENMARPPSGGDTDQLRAAAAGECDIAIANHYYYARLLNSDEPKDVEVANQLTVNWLEQGDGQRGNHINVSGAGLTKASKNKENAIALIEYLLSPEAQAWYAEVNNEYPAVSDIETPEQLKALGEYRADALGLEKLGENNRKAVELMDKAGWQ